jgi:hypothetical protein
MLGLGAGDVMRRPWVLALAAGAVAMCGAGPVAVAAEVVPGRASPAASLWGQAIEIPGLAALSQGKAELPVSVSCPTPGNCAAVGDYLHGSGAQGFVVDERNGQWGQAIELPGLGVLNTGGNAEVNQVSCASAGNCAAAGQYEADGQPRGFVADERNGHWGRAIEVPGLGALEKGGKAYTFSVSCGSAGNCSAGGDFARSRVHGFLVSEKNGRWGRAIEVPGLAALPAHRGVRILLVSCGSAGNCAAAGSYTDKLDSAVHGLVVDERNGRWGPALGVRSLGLQSVINSLSCASAGNCAIGGYFDDSVDHGQGFVANEVKGRWHRAIGVPGLAALNKGDAAAVNSVSCSSAGDCTASGAYPAHGHYNGFLAVEKNGRWGKAFDVPGLAALGKGKDTGAFSDACAPDGTCAVGGSYLIGRTVQAYVAVERNGRWRAPVEVRGLAGLSKGGNASIDSLACASTSSCIAVGIYGDPHGQHGFVTG